MTTAMMIDLVSLCFTPLFAYIGIRAAMHWYSRHKPGHVMARLFSLDKRGQPVMVEIEGREDEVAKTVRLTIGKEPMPPAAQRPS